MEGPIKYENHRENKKINFNKNRISHNSKTNFNEDKAYNKFDNKNNENKVIYSNFNESNANYGKANYVDNANDTETSLKKTRKIFIIISVVVLILAAMITIGGTIAINNFINEVSSENSALTQEERDEASSLIEISSQIGVIGIRMLFILIPILISIPALAFIWFIYLIIYLSVKSKVKDE